jgi:hypothetical protein
MAFVFVWFSEQASLPVPEIRKFQVFGYGVEKQIETPLFIDGRFLEFLAVAGYDVKDTRHSLGHLNINLPGIVANPEHRMPILFYGGFHDSRRKKSSTV